MRPIGFSLAFTACLVLFGACKQEEERPPQTPAPTAYPMPPPPGPTAGGPMPAPTPAPAPAPGPAPAPAPTAAPAPSGGPGPVAGFPCAYDTDLACPFGRCINGRCGGCQSASDCKPGAACLSTPLGMACMPGAPTSAPAPAPTATTPAPAPTTTAPAPPSDPYAAARARCLERTNQYRAGKGVAALSLRSGRNACADSQAQSDAASRKPHGAFGKCAEAAQNECPGWSGPLETVIDSCLDMMFKEGPGSGPEHGHYTNMMEPSYRSVACGFQVTSDGAVWMTQDFYR